MKRRIGVIPVKKEASNPLLKRNAKPVCLKGSWRRAQGKEKRGSLLYRQREDQNHLWKEPRIRAPESGGVHPRMRRFVLCMSASTCGLCRWTLGLAGTLTKRPAGRVSPVSGFFKLFRVTTSRPFACLIPLASTLLILPVIFTSYFEWLYLYLWEDLESCIVRLHLSSCHPSSSVCVGRISEEMWVFIWFLTSAISSPL